jgi:hypothetical protein
MSLVRGVALLVVLSLFAIAGAGLIMLLDHPPSEQGRPELSARDHGLLAPRLAALDTGVDRLVDAGDDLATAGRDALTRLRALDPDGTDAALAAGIQVAANIGAIHDDLVQQRATLTEGIDQSRLTASDRVRIGALDRALSGAADLPTAWTGVAAAVTDPEDLVRSIQAHDARVVDATDAGRAGDWATAITALADAQRLLVPARAVRETANKAGADVSTLDDLLARFDTYDDVLGRLYTKLQASGGVVSDDIRLVYGQVQDAQTALPENQDALRLVISDLAGPTVTSALLDIETARGMLEAAVDARPDASAS